jgi:hypothetical protein
VKILMIALLNCSILAFAVACQPCQSSDTEQRLDVPSPEDQIQSPHDENATHPDEVARIMKLLPQIPTDASYDKIIAMLGLLKDWEGSSVSNTHCTMVWYISPGYAFVLNFDPVFTAGKRTLVFTEASFSAQKKPGFPSDEYHTVYPYRSWKGMVYK